ncbi:hypothetical protein AMTRI_Chr11g154040 [Amborella trichopoda]|uniref:probable LRR receptor-like serine/threonine-protein kinase IRK n=1 Tax=Amborella trichopoda TaxID=13333 RepID=UPI0009BF8D67|nr:probable LRR receptor-like serine/threonine-protein kinase IRK [Amborella trichopoda]|eukprot:XP_020530634.1 probable LRR receptor-like serine/threonine-protein kinase IRK [Amborella trichopoda]
MSGEIAEFLKIGVCDKSQNPMPSLMYLWLSNNQLHGKLPEWIFQIETLVDLEVSHNKLQGQIPLSMGRLTALETLGLGGNDLNGYVPSSLGQLSKLAVLDISSNHLTGLISETHFRDLLNLKILDMSSNSLVFNLSLKWVPPFRVTKLNMRSRNLGSQFPNWVKNQREVMYLDLSNTSIFYTIPNWFWDISTNLSLLNLSNNQIEGQLPNPFMIHAFADVDLSFNLFEGLIPIPSSDLTMFDLSSNHFHGPIPSSIGESAPSNIFLSLSNNRITGPIPMSIGGMMYLQVLDLSRYNLTGNIPPSIGNCSYLKVIDMSSNKLSGGIPLSFIH